MIAVLEHFTWPRAAISDMQLDVLALRLAVLKIPARLAHLERLAGEVASDLRAVRAELAAAEAAKQREP